jgi:HEAT repeat protein
VNEAANLATIADSSADEDVAWQAIRALQNAATRIVLERVIELTTARETSVRSRAASVLGQLGIPQRLFPDECLDALVALLEIEQNEEVIESALVALGHLRRTRHLETITRFSTHKDHEIRHAVAFALGGRGEPEAVATLTRLTGDSEAKIRDWATFGIGQIGTVNTPEVCEALFNRLDDSDPDTRFEAICGLAHHGDRRALQPLLEVLKVDPTNDDLWQPAYELLGIDPNSEDLAGDALIARLEALL